MDDWKEIRFIELARLLDNDKVDCTSRYQVGLAMINPKSAGRR